jgi:hypothetical protein
MATRGQASTTSRPKPGCPTAPSRTTSSARRSSSPHCYPRALASSVTRSSPPWKHRPAAATLARRRPPQGPDSARRPDARPRRPRTDSANRSPARRLAPRRARHSWPVTDHATRPGPDTATKSKTPSTPGSRRFSTATAPTAAPDVDPEHSHSRARPQCTPPGHGGQPDRGGERASTPKRLRDRSTSACASRDGSL